MTSQSGHGFLSILFGGKYDLIQLHRQIIDQNDGVSIETINTGIFHLRFKENNENDMTAQIFWLFLIPANGPANS